MPKNIRECIPIAIEVIEKNLKTRVKDIKAINSGRHYILTTDKNLNYYMMFKRAFFNSFGKIFGRGNEVGESINLEYLDYALRWKIDAFLFIYEKGHVYTVPVQEFYDFANNHNTIRKQHNNIEKTASIPIRLLRRWK